MQNDGERRDVTLAFRCAGSMLHMVRAAAARNGVLVSDFLREATETALRRELVDNRDQEHPRNPAAGF